MSSRASLPVSTCLTASYRSRSWYGMVKRIIFMDSRSRAKWSARRKPAARPSRVASTAEEWAQGVAFREVAAGVRVRDYSVSVLAVGRAPVPVVATLHNAAPSGALTGAVYALIEGQRLGFSNTAVVMGVLMALGATALTNVPFPGAMPSLIKRPA